MPEDTKEAEVVEEWREEVLKSITENVILGTWDHVSPGEDGKIRVSGTPLLTEVTEHVQDYFSKIWDAKVVPDGEDAIVIVLKKRSS